MPAYQTVVVGVHENMPAKSIQLTASLAVETGAKLVLVAAYKGSDTGGAHRVDTHTTDTEAGDAFKIVEPAELALKRAAAMCHELGHHNVESYAIAGDPVTVLTSAVEEHDAELLVVGSRGLAGLADRLLGSVPGNLTRQIGCDVLVVHTTGGSRRGRRLSRLWTNRHRSSGNYQRTLVVGVHDSPRSRRAAERAGAIAADHKAEVVLVGAYEDMEWSELKHARDTLGEESHLVQGTFPIESALRDGEAKARAKGADAVSQVIVHGDAMKGLLREADKRRADVLVLGNHQLSGRMAQLIGSISSQVSRKTDTHILLVH
jgi:nucleotide-binding universal stress UspA family protein